MLYSLSDQFAIVQDGLNRWIAGDAAPARSGAATLDGDSWREGIKAFRTLVADDDTVTVETCEALMERAPASMRAPLREIHRALIAYDFEGALGMIDEIIGEMGG